MKSFNIIPLKRFYLKIVSTADDLNNHKIIAIQSIIDQLLQMF